MHAIWNSSGGLRRSPAIAPASGDLRRSGVRSRWSEAPFPCAMARMTVV